MTSPEITAAPISTSVALERLRQTLASQFSSDVMGDFPLLLSDVARVREFHAGDTIIGYFEPGQAVEFLLSGEVAFWSGEDCKHELARTDQPSFPLGWSAFREPGHYLSHVTAETPVFTLSIQIEPLVQRLNTMPNLMPRFFGWMFEQAASLVEQGRAPLGEEHPLAFSPKPYNLDADQELIQSLQSSGFFAAFSDAEIQVLKSHISLIDGQAGQELVQQGMPSPGIIMLIWGQIDLNFSPVDAPEQARVRHVDRPGTVVAWAQMGTNAQAPYSIKPTRSALLAFLSNEALQSLVLSQPYLVAKIFNHQVTIVGRFLRSAKALSEVSNSHSGLDVFKALVADNRPGLAVQSELFVIPALLEQSETRPEGFRRLQYLQYQGSERERTIAALALDILESLRRETRFTVGLMQAHDDVVKDEGHLSARLASQAQIFAEAFEQLDFVIEGQENLPNDPNCIFIFNQLPSPVSARLPNGLMIDLCAEFVSSMIAFKAYGSASRLISAEGGRFGYYLRARGAINAEGGYEAEAAQALAQGFPLMIAPEGMRRALDQKTEFSPGPMKAGAFSLSRTLPSKPKVIPVALAWFERQVAETKLCASIRPALDLEGVELDKLFLRNFRTEFKSWVTRAAALESVSSQAPVPRLQEEFENDVVLREIKDTKGQCSVMLYGSSSMRLWENAEADLGLPGLQNRAFGGSTIAAAYTYFDRLVAPLEPKSIIFYSGDNDLARGLSTAKLMAHFEKLASKIARRLPDTRVLLISVKPSPNRLGLMGKAHELNLALQQRVETLDTWKFVDIWPDMLDAKGTPKAELFGGDRLHMNEAGYAVWADALKPQLAWLQGA